MADLKDDITRHHREAFGWALACCRWDRSTAEDVLQSVYLQLIDGRATFNGKSEFRTFLFAVIRRTASKERRRRAVRQAFSLSALFRDTTTEDVAPTGLDSITRAETSRALGIALDQLSARQREVLHLVFYQDLTIAAAAEVLGISVGSARVHYERGKARLRELLGDEERSDAHDKRRHESSEPIPSLRGRGRGGRA